MIGAAQTAIVSAHDDRNASSMDLIEATARDLDHIVDGGVRGAARCLREMAQAAGDEIDATWRAGGGLSGLGTSFSEIDRITRGLRPGNLVILAARPAMGKTTLAVNISHKLALEDCPTGFFSMEMTGDELITRMAVSTSGVDLDSVLEGKYRNDTEAMQVIHAAHNVGQLPIQLDDTPGLTTQGIRTRARAMVRKHGIRLIIIDHLGRIARDRRNTRNSNDFEHISQVVTDLKNMAKELNVPVMVLCQLNRSLESRDDKRPMLSDLRQSGRIEEEADVVLAVYRDEYYLERSEPRVRVGESGEDFSARMANWSEKMDQARGKAEVIALKLRQGKVSTARIDFNGGLCRFESRADQRQEGMGF